MIKAFVFLIFTFTLFTNANALVCTTKADCSGNQSCINGKCSIRTGCTSNAECASQRMCIGARIQPTCVDHMEHPTCQSSCVKDSATSNYYVDNGGVRKYYDLSCLRNTSLGGTILGSCELDIITESMCWFQKILIQGLAKWLILIVMVTIGMRIFLTGKPPEMKDLLTLLASIAMIFGSIQIVSMILGVSASVC